MAQAADLEIRDAESRHCAAIAEIYNQAIRAGANTMDTEPKTAGYYEDMRRGFDPHEALLVCELDGAVVGWGVIKRYSDRPGYRFACETSVYVDEADHGRGHGGRLLEAVKARAALLGYRHLVAKIVAVNSASIRFHERHGYEIVGYQRAIGYLHGAWHDVAILQCLLPPDDAEALARGDMAD